jgi:hypothetical protein
MLLRRDGFEQGGIMSASELIRWGALSAILGGVLLVISDLWGLLMEGLGGDQPFSVTARSASFAITSGLSLLAAILILFALVGLNLRQSEEVGILGRLGFVVAFFGTALTVGLSWVIFFVAPSVAMEAPEFLDAEQVAGPLDAGFILTSLILAVGWALFGVAALRAGIYPRWVTIVFIIAALIQFLPLPGTALVFGVAVALLGFFALARGSMSVEQPSRVR